MTKKTFATYFGLVVLAMSLFASTAFAANPHLYQATQSINCTNSAFTPFTFNVPSGKTLVVTSVNVFVGSYTVGDTFGVTMYADDGSTSFLGFGLQSVGGRFNSWDSTWTLNQQIQLSAVHVVKGSVSRDSQDYVPACYGTVTISGELDN